MKDYTEKESGFTDHVSLLETTDTNHADNFNVSTKMLFGNTMSNRKKLGTHADDGTIHVTEAERDSWNDRVSKDGDTMNGPLSVPTLILGRTPSTAAGAMWIE